MSSVTILAADLLLELLRRAAEVSAIIRNAKAQGREVSAEELDALVQGYDAARKAAADALAGN